MSDRAEQTQYGCRHWGTGTAVFCLLMLGLTGCWHGEARKPSLIGPVDSGRLWRSAHDAFWQPQTLVPLTGALLFTLDDFDQRASQWAIKHQPVYGSYANANRASDDYLAVLIGQAAVTALARPADSGGGTWSEAKARQLAVEGVTVGTTYAVVQGLKEGIGRTGPDNWKDTSMPSGHASGAFLFSTLTNRNVDALCPNPYLRVSWQATNILLATAVSWARVEGGHHYPSDVLVGAGVGHFMAAFVHDAFLPGRSGDAVGISILPTSESTLAGCWWRF